MRPTYLHMKKNIMEYKEHVCKVAVKNGGMVVAKSFEISATEFEVSM